MDGLYVEEEDIVAPPHWMAQVNTPYIEIPLKVNSEGSLTLKRKARIMMMKDHLRKTMRMMRRKKNFFLLFI